MNAYAQPDYSLFSRRTLAFVLIAGLHGILIFALANGFSHTPFEVIPQRIQAVVLPAIQRTVEQPPPIPQPTFSPPVFKIPPTEFPPEFPPDDPPTTREVGIGLENHGAAPPLTPVHSVNRVLGGPGKAFPNTNDFYPPRAIRNGEKGVATVNACVDDKGRLTAAPTLAKTSGSASLDDGALKLAKAGSGHYRPTTEDGRPVSSCYGFLVRFEFKD
jgi:TonB family protein